MWVSVNNCNFIFWFSAIHQHLLFTYWMLLLLFKYLMPFSFFQWVTDLNLSLYTLLYIKVPESMTLRFEQSNIQAIVLRQRAVCHSVTKNLRTKKKFKICHTQKLNKLYYDRKGFITHCLTLITLDSILCNRRCFIASYYRDWQWLRLELKYYNFNIFGFFEIAILFACLG